MSFASRARLCLCAAGLLLCQSAAGLGRTESRAEPAGSGYEQARQRMVSEQIAARGVSDRRVLEAMRAVPRHLFVPGAQRGSAYADHPLPIGYGQTISQPYIVAYMTEALELRPGQSVLEIGTGSGYQAAVLAALTERVFTVEIVQALAARSAELFRELGLASIKSRQADGWYGWEEQAPFDAIIVTAAAGHIPPPLVKQLKPGGRMIIPVGGPFDAQVLVLIEKDLSGRIERRALLPVRFVPMTGAAAAPP